MSAARRIVRVVSALQLADIPAPVITAAKLHFLDAIGVGLAASTVPLAASWADGARRAGGGDGPASVLGRTGGLPAAMAALVNGALIHSLEYDDTHIASVVHGGSVAAPAALAVAEDCGAGGADLLVGYISAWEVMVRLGLAAPGAYQANGFQISAAGGALGAAVAAALIRGLPEDRAVSAIGIAGSQASGLLAFLSDGSTVKALHPGWAAHTGITAVALADAGMTGPETILEGRFGFLDAFARDPDAAGRLGGLLEDLGGIWHLPDAAFKRFPCCHYIHPFLEAMQALIDGNLGADDIAAIICHVPPPMVPLICEPWQRRQNPASGYDGKWGLAYCLAALLVDGRVDVATFAVSPDPEIVNIARKIEWRPMEVSAFPRRFEALVEARLHDGRIQSHRVDSVQGAPDRPIAEAEVIAKFRANAGRAMEAWAVEAVLQAILALDEASALAPLSAALRNIRP